MLQFIVLGIVPGTSIQLSFTDVLLIAGTALLVFSLASYYLSRRLREQARQHLLNQLAL